MQYKKEESANNTHYIHTTNKCKKGINSFIGILMVNNKEYPVAYKFLKSNKLATFQLLKRLYIRFAD
jgi:hypothetical protein